MGYNKPFRRVCFCSSDGYDPTEWRHDPDATDAEGEPSEDLWVGERTLLGDCLFSFARNPRGRNRCSEPTLLAVMMINSREALSGGVDHRRRRGRLHTCGRGRLKFQKGLPDWSPEDPSNELSELDEERETRSGCRGLYMSANNEDGGSRASTEGSRLGPGFS